MPSKVQLFGPDDRNTTIWSPGSEQNPDGCANVYSSLFVEGYFYKVCPTGFSSNQLYLSLPAGFVSSTVSQEEATQFARELLAAKGAELAEASGVCSLGEFQEVFSTVDATFNWDWVADKATLFPREISNKLPDGSGYGTGDDSGIIVEFPIGNSLSWPLMIGFFYSDTALFLNEVPNQVVPSDPLRLDIQDDYGLLHLDLMHFQHDTHPNLVVYAGGDFNGNFAPNDVDNYLFQNTTLYAGKLIADFGSREIYGPDWDEETDGNRNLEDNPFKTQIPNPDYQPEFTVASLGGFLFRIDTSSRSIINGKLAGVYLVCYKEDIQVYKYDVGADDYISVGTIPFNPQNTTTYYGASILFDGTNKFLEIYIDGQFELSIADDTLTNIHLPICYQRGVFSVDYWVGDIVSGQTYPGTNRLPPPITTRYFEPTDILNPDVQSPAEPEKKILFPAEIVGAATLLEANAPFPKLAAGEVEVGFTKDLIAANTQVANWFGGAFFGQAINILMNFDTAVYPELGKVLWGAQALQVGKIEMNRSSSVPNIPSNPYKFLMTAYQICPIIESEEILNIDWTDYDLFQYFMESYNQHPRWSCSWDGVFQPAALFEDTEAEESGNATQLRDLNDTETPVFQAGLYEAVPEQTGDGWMYTTSMMNMLPGRVSTTPGTGEFKDILTKTDLNNHYYFFTEGWYSVQVITDLFSAIRTVKLMTGLQGKRTSEILEKPVYDFNYACPVPPTFEPPPNVNLECPNIEYVLTGQFTGIDGTGNFFEFANDTTKDCLFGDPLDSVCYPGGTTWSEGYNMNPVLVGMFGASPEGIQVFFNANPTEMVHVGARIMEKIFILMPRLVVTVFKEGWPGKIYEAEMLLELHTEINDPPATDIGFSTLTQACYLIPPLAVASYFEDTGSDFVDLIEVGPTYKFVFTLPTAFVNA